MTRRNPRIQFREDVVEAMNYSHELQESKSDNFQVSERVVFQSCKKCGMYIKHKEIHKVGTDRFDHYIDTKIYIPVQEHVCRDAEKRKLDEANARLVPVTEPDEAPDTRIKGLVERLDK